MSKTIDCVLLVDDDEDDNFFHERAISKTGLACLVEKASDGVDALQYLDRCLSESKRSKPNIIFLDVNMPRMDGFEFLDNYAKLPKDVRAEMCVIILSTSTSPRDIERAKNHESIDCYVTKPLTSDSFQKIINAYWKGKDST